MHVCREEIYAGRSSIESVHARDARQHRDAPPPRGPQGLCARRREAARARDERREVSRPVTSASPCPGVSWCADESNGWHGIYVSPFARSAALIIRVYRECRCVWCSERSSRAGRGVYGQRSNVRATGRRANRNTPYLYIYIALLCTAVRLYTVVEIDTS